MSQKRARIVTVTDAAGLRGTFDPSEEFADERGTTCVPVHLDDGRRAVVAVDQLDLDPDGGAKLPFSFAQAEAALGDGAPARRAADDGRVVIPVVAEQLEIEKRKVEAGGFRISKTVTEREEVVDQPLMREEVQVKRVPVNQFVDAPVPVRHVGDTMIIPLLEEVLVVEKRLMLKEELHIKKAEVETHRPQRVTLRSEQAHVERIGDDVQPPSPVPYESGEGRAASATLVGRETGSVQSGDTLTAATGGETTTIITPRPRGGDRS
jgi:uncharacterized protein (TIGR02271 family)